MNYANLAVSLGIQGFIAGKELRAKCPLHHDNNPSFSLNVENGLWTCFAGCGSGDFVRLVELVLDCNSQEAHDWIREGKANSVEQLSKALYESLFQKSETISEKSPEHWKNIFELAPNNVIPNWFLARGFTWKTIFNWNIRYDNLNDAVIIPVYWHGNLVGTVTRNTSQNLPKYQNSPNLPRKNILYGEIFSSRREIIITEGILDALWLWQLGYNVVSILGNIISSEQVDILEGYRFGEIILALDNDEAGQNGTKEAYSKLTKSGWLLPQIKHIEFPPGIKDPQDCSPEEFAILFSERRGYLHELKFW